MSEKRCICTASVLDLGCPVHHDEVAAIVVDAIDGGRAIQAQPPGRCELCGDVAETRPYGPNSEEICCPCGDKNPATTKAQFYARMGWDKP